MLQLIHRLRSDEALMRAYQCGDADAFECLYRRHKDALFAYLYRSCQRRHVVEELAQDTWTAVINRAPQYRPDASFKTWLYRIASHRMADFWRRRDNHHSSLGPEDELVVTPTQVESEQLSSQLWQAIARLPQDQRDALLLQEQGFSLREITSITGAGDETVKSRLRYARGQLREQLGDLL